MDFTPISNHLLLSTYPGEYLVESRFSFFGSREFVLISPDQTDVYSLVNLKKSVMDTYNHVPNTFKEKENFKHAVTLYDRLDIECDKLETALKTYNTFFQLIVRIRDWLFGNQQIVKNKILKIDQSQVLEF